MVPPPLVFGIYGFQFTRPFQVGDLTLTPLYQYPVARQLAADDDAFNLTGYGTVGIPSTDPHIDAARIALLSAGMTFAQQQNILTSLLIQLSDGDSVDLLVSKERLGRPWPALGGRITFGSCIAADDWAPASRPSFLQVFMGRFLVEQKTDLFRQAMFRQLEIWRLGTPFIELHHYLAFSALELLARSHGPHADDQNAAVPITDMLKASGFDVTQTEVERWTTARNGMFHNGRLLSQHKGTGQWVSLTDHLTTLTAVLADTLLKQLPFDDGHINWKRWRDRQSYI